MIIGVCTYCGTLLQTDLNAGESVAPHFRTVHPGKPYVWRPADA